MKYAMRAPAGEGGDDGGAREGSDALDVPADGAGDADQSSTPDPASGGDQGGEGGAGKPAPKTTEDAIREALGESAAVEKPDDPALGKTAGDGAADPKVAARGDVPGKAAAPDGKGGAGAGAGEPDPDLVAPTGLSKGAQERFEKLVSRVKEASAANEQLQSQVQQFHQVYEASGASPQEFGELIAFSRLMKSGDADSLLRGWAMMEQYRERVLRSLPPQFRARLMPQQQQDDFGGYGAAPRGGFDPLAGYDDLSTKVENGEMTREAAEELAYLRDQVGQHRQHDQQQHAQQAQQQAQHTELLRTRDVLHQLEAGWAKNPHYAMALLPSNDDPNKRVSIRDAVHNYAVQLGEQVMAGQLAPGALPAMIATYYAGLEQAARVAAGRKDPPPPPRRGTYPREDSGTGGKNRQTVDLLRDMFGS
jgi:hypothetical protein